MMKMTLFMPLFNILIFFYKKDVKRTQNLSTPKNNFGALRKIPLGWTAFLGVPQGFANRYVLLSSNGSLLFCS